MCFVFFCMTEETLRQQYLEQKKKLQWETDLELHSKFLDRKVLLEFIVSIFLYLRLTVPGQNQDSVSWVSRLRLESQVIAQRSSSKYEILCFSRLFTALHALRTRSCDENSVCLSVCPSVCQTRALWQNGRKICLDFYTIRKNIYSSFLRRRTVGGGDPFYPKFWVKRPPLEHNRRFWTNNRS